MTQPIGSITFACGKCGETIAIDEANPPKDDAVVTCPSCGEVFGFYSLSKERLKDEAHAEGRKWFDETFGKGPGRK